MHPMGAAYATAGMNTGVRYAMTNLGDLLTRMKETPDGAGNLLDNSLVYATSDVSFGKAHSIDEYPILMFGKAGGAIKGDMHLRVNKDNPSKLLYTIINAFGGNITTFGTGAGLVTTGVPEIMT
jgi:hypothetical protein